MTFDKNVVNNFVQVLPDIIGDTPFGLIMDSEGEPEEPVYYDDIKNEICKIDSNAEFYFGISKMVIAAPSLGDIVIKIPFKGFYNYYCGEEDFNDDLILSEDDILHIYDDVYTFLAFNRAIRYKDDYCAVEELLYRDMYNKNIEIFVAETQYFTTLSNGLKIYIQEKVIPMADDEDFNKRKSSAHSKNIAKKWQDEDSIPLDVDWIGLCIDNYGESLTEAFLHYCNYTEPIVISDTHDGNIGYRLDGTPCILDYSGFRN